MKCLRILAVLAALQGGALFAQTLTGTWQGALKIPQAPNGELRIVVKIAISDADKLKADLYSIDQQTPALPATGVSLNGSTFKMTIAAVNGNFEGKLSADEKSIVGTWTQGMPFPLTLVKATPRDCLDHPRTSAAAEDDGRQGEAEVRSRHHQTRPIPPARVLESTWTEAASSIR